MSKASLRRKAGDREYASMTAKGADARSSWGRACSPIRAPKERVQGMQRIADMHVSVHVSRQYDPVASLSQLSLLTVALLDYILSLRRRTFSL